VGAIAVASVRSCHKLPPCLIKTVPVGSKTDPLLAKAYPISLCDNIFKKRKKKLQGENGSRERGVRQCERNNSADTKVSEEGEGGGA